MSKGNLRIFTFQASASYSVSDFLLHQHFDFKRPFSCQIIPRSVTIGVAQIFLDSYGKALRLSGRSKYGVIHPE